MNRQRNLDEAENELNEAKRNGFKPGRREQKDLADGYRVRGERWLAAAHGAHDVAGMQESLKHADSDLAHAQELYNEGGAFPRRNGSADGREGFARARCDQADSRRGEAGRHRGSLTARRATPK